jgi:hypothetical protein
MGQQGDKLGRVGRPAHARSGKEGQWPGRVCGLRKKKRKAGRRKWAAREKGVREERGFEFFLSNSFQIRFFSNFQTSIKQQTMHSNHDAQSLIISNFIK